MGALLVIAAVVCAVLARTTLFSDHPAYLVTLVAVDVVGFVLVATGLQRVPADRPRHRAATVVGRVAGALATVLVIGSIVYLIPLPATPDAIAAQANSSAVSVETSPTRIVLTPIAPPRAGLVFLPGAKVDPRAYLPLLREIATAGYLVVIVKEPYDIAFFATGEPAKVVAAYPNVQRWAVGGHSLGGVVAGIASPDVRGLLLWASYPLGSLADRSDLVAASISGTADPLTTPADIEASRAHLPPGTVFTAIDGGIHAYFGDYGAQPGDGTPGVDRATAQQQIVAATTTFMEAVATSG